MHEDLWCGRHVTKIQNAVHACNVQYATFLCVYRMYGMQVGHVLYDSLQTIYRSPLPATIAYAREMLAHHPGLVPFAFAKQHGRAIRRHMKFAFSKSFQVTCRPLHSSAWAAPRTLLLCGHHAGHAQERSCNGRPCRSYKRQRGGSSCHGGGGERGSAYNSKGGGREVPEPAAAIMVAAASTEAHIKAGTWVQVARRHRSQ